jgi:hypothetical protein
MSITAYSQQSTAPAPVRVASSYAKSTPTFSDALALVRRHLWTQTTFPTSLPEPDSAKVLRALFAHLGDLLYYAA